MLPGSTHPADLDLATFAAYKRAREEAKKFGISAGFEAERQRCINRRSRAANKCGAQWCKANAVCGKPCTHEWGSPPKEVIPKQPTSGNRFYEVKHGITIEVHNKELRTKEVYFRMLLLCLPFCSPS